MNAARGAGRSQRLRGRGGRAEFYARSGEAQYVAVGAELHDRRLESDSASASVRTTRKVAATEAGERLLGAGPGARRHRRGARLVGELRDKPAGTIRITTSEHPAHTILWPALKTAADYPDIEVELTIDPASPTSLRNVSTLASGSANRSPRTWLRCALAPICAWWSSARRTISPQGRSRRLPRIWPIISASICDFPPRAGSTPGNSEREAARTESSRRWPGRVQQRADDHRAASRVSVSPVCSKTDRGLRRRRSPRPRARRLVPAFSRLSPLLSEPPPALRRIHPVGGRAALSSGPKSRRRSPVCFHGSLRPKGSSRTSIAGYALRSLRR